MLKSSLRPRLVFAVIVAVTSLCIPASDAFAGRGLDYSLREELQVARRAVEIERGMEALRTESASLKFAESIMRDRAMESVRKIRAYSELRGAGEQQARTRTRTMYKLARGGIPRLIVESKLEKQTQRDDASLARAQRAHALQRLLGNDMRVLARHRRSEARAREELVAASREMAAASSLRMIREVQESILNTSMASLQPQLRRARRRRVFALSQTSELNTWERRLLRQVKQQYRALSNGYGLDLLDVGALARPVSGRIVGRYGESKDRLLDLPTYRDGVELRASGRRPFAVAAADGVVVAAGELSGFEEVVVLEHPGGFLTLTGHLRGLVVRQGQEVRRGETLGKVASKTVKDGLGSTVYFELRHGERPIDPSRFLRKF